MYSFNSSIPSFLQFLSFFASSVIYIAVFTLASSYHFTQSYRIFAWSSDLNYHNILCSIYVPSLYHLHILLYPLRCERFRNSSLQKLEQENILSLVRSRVYWTIGRFKSPSATKHMLFSKFVMQLSAAHSSSNLISRPFIFRGYLALSSKLKKSLTFYLLSTLQGSY